MTANYKTLADFEVATAEEAQSYFMDQAIIKVDTSADLTSLPTTVKTAYVLNTGILMARNVANAWVPTGGAATVNETAPSNPQTGQLWVKPSEVLPAPVRVQVSGSFPISATTFTDLASGPTAAITVPRACMVQVDAACFLRCFGSGAGLRAIIAWTGALTGDTSNLFGGLPGNMYNAPSGANDSYHTGALPFTIALPVGTTTFKFQAMKDNANTNPSLNYPRISVTPTAWLDAYAAGAS